MTTIYIPDDTRPEIESWGEVLAVEQAVRLLVIVRSELDENYFGRILGVNPRKVHCVTLVVLVNDIEFCSVGTVHFAEVLEIRKRYGGSR